MWGYRIHPTKGYYKFHNGIDLGIGEGTKIYAAASGTVAAITKKSSCGGNKVYVHSYVNGKAYTHYYFHLLKIDVKVGDKVLVHAGLIIQTMDARMADEMDELFREIEDLNI